MNNLKTLKDIEDYYGENCVDEDSRDNVLVFQEIRKFNKDFLRQEAIKWIKEIGKITNGTNFYNGFIKEDIGKFGCYCDFDNYTDFEGTIKFIKCFFGITQEDLK